MYAPESHLTTADVSPATTPSGTTSRQRSILLVMACTLFGAAAQMLIKTGANSLPHVSGFFPNLLAMASSVPLVAGYSLYGISTVLLVVALKHGELSMLYPIIALTYVWVAILSVVVFHEYLSPLRVAGVIVIVLGVAILGRDKF